MAILIDPPSGWRYGFPKRLPDPSPTDVVQWLIDNGYPEALVNQFEGRNVPCWYSEINDEVLHS